MKDRLRRRGRPLRKNDIWIAANALQPDFTLATRQAQFCGVGAVHTEVWQPELIAGNERCRGKSRRPYGP